MLQMVSGSPSHWHSPPTKTTNPRIMPQKVTFISSNIIGESHLFISGSPSYMLLPLSIKECSP